MDIVITKLSVLPPRPKVRGSQHLRTQRRRITMTTKNNLDVEQTALLGQEFQDRLEEIAITRTLAPATGLVLNYVVSTRPIDLNVNQQVTAYRTLDEAMADYKGRFNKLKRAGDMATIQLLTTIGTVVLDVFVKTQSR